MPIACTYTQETKYRGMKGKPKELILSVNVLPNGEHIGQTQKRVSIKVNNHTPDGEKHRWPQVAEKPHP